MSSILSFLSLALNLVTNSLEAVTTLLFMVVNLSTGVLGWLAYAPAFLVPILIIVIVAGVIKWFFGR